MKTKILYEDPDILVIYKPAGIATQTAKVGQADVVSELTNYLAKNRMDKSKGGMAPFIGVVHRLDQPVEGVLVFGKHKQATAALNTQLTDGTLKKHYLAAVCGKPTEKSARLVDYMIKDRDGLAKIVAETNKEAKKAVLDYRVLGTNSIQVGAGRVHSDEEIQSVEASLLEVILKTGRFHQIRVQMSGTGCPLLGDQKYGNGLSMTISNSLNIKSAALCAYHLEFMHPKTGKKMEYTVNPENKTFAIFQNYLP